MPKRKHRIRRLVRIPTEYFEVLPISETLFPPLYQFENGLRLAINRFLSTCYTAKWWDVSLKARLPDIHTYAAEQQTKRAAMPWIGASPRTPVLPIHLVTLGHLEKIVENYQSDCIPQLFPNLHFFLGHMECIKRVRNLYTHMFPCLTSGDARLAKREILTLASHVNLNL
jgi:hypothetical protein